MMFVDERQRTINEVVKDLEGYKSGFTVTLNTLGEDPIKFDSVVEKLVWWLNKYCYGRNFIKKLARLRALGGTEYGKINSGLHIHLLITHNDNIDRSWQEIEFFIRDKWYKLMNSRVNSSIYGTLVHIEKIYDVEGIVKYLTKTFYQQKNQFNIQFF